MLKAVRDILYITKKFMLYCIHGGNGLETDVLQKMVKDVHWLEKRGVKFSYEGVELESGRMLRKILVAEPDSAYMKDYVYEQGKLAKADYRKIRN